MKNRKFVLLPEFLYHCEKNEIKVFGKGFGEEPFLRKVCPDKLLINHPYIYNLFSAFDVVPIEFHIRYALVIRRTVQIIYISDISAELQYR